jgi:adenine-specific DNA-methyltransferase
LPNPLEARAGRRLKAEEALGTADEGWAKVAKNLKAEIGLERIEAYGGSISLPFELGDHKRVAVKVIDDRGFESLKVLQL